MSALQSCLYEGIVMHKRIRPARHGLRYSVFNVLLDIDELPHLGERLRLFAYNKAGVTGFHDRDHGDGTGAPLRAWVERQLTRAGIELDGGAIRILCYPRIFGYVFNPLSVYYCHHRDSRLVALIYEVNNTFGERHCYLIPVSGTAGGAVRQECDKLFYVSPFISVGGQYRFRISAPEREVSIAITQVDADGPLLHAVFNGMRVAIDDRNLASVLLRYPLLTLKVIGGIHWEALRLWWKGVPLVQHPPPPDDPVTIVSPRT